MQLPPTSPPTAPFAEASASLLPLLSALGSVFNFATKDLTTKRADLLACAAAYPTLDVLIAADVAAGTVWTKNSHSRNLHRVTMTLKFLNRLGVYLREDPNATLSACAAKVWYALGRRL